MGPLLDIVLCYPFLDLRFLVNAPLEPRWLEGDYTNVGTLGAVTRGQSDGQEAELRLDAALLFAGEYSNFGPTGLPTRRQKPDAGDGLVVTDRRLLADSYGQVRVEVVFQAPDVASGFENTLERILTTSTYVVRMKHTEMISAGAQLARIYLEQSAKTAGSPSGEAAMQLVKEGAGSPFLIALRRGTSGGEVDGPALPDKPSDLAAVTFRRIELAGQPTGVWQLWLGDNPSLNWQPTVRMLCRIICQLSEVTLLVQLLDEPEALAPYLLAKDKTEDFLAERTRRLRRTKQGDWSVAAVSGFASQHLRVSIEDTKRFRGALKGMVAKDLAGSLATTMERITKSEVTVPVGPKAIEQEDKTRLVDLLAAQAQNEQGYFRRLVQQAPLDEEFKQQRQDSWSGQPKSDALNLVDWALAKGVNPADKGYSTLASILLQQLGRLDFEDAATIVAILSRYGLILDKALIEGLRWRFQVPIASYRPDARPTSLGPDFVWHGPNTALELQSWLRPARPEFLDVGYLVQAIKHARAVCLVSVGAIDQFGTGVLIGRHFVLTNYHVMVPKGSNIPPNTHAGSVKLHFGVFSQSDEKNEFELDPTDPVPIFSPTEKLDYVLLRVSADIEAAKVLQVAIPERKPPGLKSSLSILQHPFGSEMKLAPSTDAVTFIDPANGIVQYVTWAAEGSSGAPCFDAQWRLVALHHAERAEPFGTIREGILIDPILKELEAKLGQAQLGGT